MDTTDPKTMWAMFDMATDPDPANTTTTTGLDGTSQQGGANPPSFDTASHPGGTSSNQPARPSSSMDSLSSLLALAAWTDAVTNVAKSAVRQ